jgi:cell division protein FtsB
MITTINRNRIYIAVLMIVCLILLSQLFQKCESEKVQMANVDALNKQNEVYKLKNGQLVTSVENLNYTNSQLKSSLLMKDKKVKELLDKFSNVKSVTKYVTNTKLDTIKLVYQDSIPCNFERVGSDLKEWYHIAYKSNQKGVEITELSIPDSVIVATGDKRKWFWGKRTSVTDITHANPFVETESIQHIEIVQPAKWYDSTILKIGVGLIGGIFLMK